VAFCGLRAASAVRGFGVSGTAVSARSPPDLQRRVMMGLPGTSKTSKVDRAAEAPRLVEWCAANAVLPDDALLAHVLDGFGPQKSGDDPFDAVVGLLGTR